MGDRTAFFYGTLMAREILNRVCYGDFNVGLAANLTIRPAVLHGFCRHRVEGVDYPGIIREEGKSVLGTYVTGLTDGDIWRLNRFEGPEYTRERVEIMILKEAEVGTGMPSAGDVLLDEKEDNGEKVVTETYVYTAGKENLEEEEWDYEEFRKEKMRNWVSGSKEYTEVDEAVADQQTASNGKAHKSGREVIVIDDDSEEEALQSAV